MSLEYVRKYYGVPAEIGRRVKVDGRAGVIASDRGCHIGVVFDDKSYGGINYPCHPTWRVEYLELVEVSDE